MFASLIKRERESRGWTLADLSARCGIAVSNLSRLENGRAEPGAVTLVRIADAFDAKLVFAPKVETRSLEEVQDRALEAQRTVTRAGLGYSDPYRRLERKARSGLDVSSELARLRALDAEA